MTTSLPARFGVPQELEARCARLKAEREGKRLTILVCCGTGCLANGSAKVADAFARELHARGIDADVGLAFKRTGCHGFCQRGPLVVMMPDETFYQRVKPKDVPKIVEQTVVGGKVIATLLYKDPNSKQRITRYHEIPFYQKQTRVAMRNIGLVDPRDLRDSLARGAYLAVAKALGAMTPEQVIAEVDQSGLRGRGGAGFSTGRKWRSARAAPGERKFVICNGDEGDPGAFKDRSILEGDPHSVIEGMIIGAYAVGAHEGFVYVREEYPLAVENLGHALCDARAAGLLGRNILGTGFDFDVQISRGGGAFVCGESSALMKSIAGMVGEPRAKYIHATDRGLFDLPSVLNNVESWSDVPVIIEKGAAWFAAMGTAKSKGTKAFSLVGKVKNTGLVETPMGITLRELIFDIGGGILNDRPFKAVQTGGPSGGCVPAHLLDLPIDYEKLTEAGSMMGSGGMIVMDDRTCMVDVARYFTRFLWDESCGKCTPCREGLSQLQIVHDRICRGLGREEDLPLMERLGAVMETAALCALGKSANFPVKSTLQYFRDEYVAHVRDKRCPAGICKDLTIYRIIDEQCNGCGACLRVCPSKAITGKPKQLHALDQGLCISCGACFDVCTPMNAIAFDPRPHAAAVPPAAPGAAPARRNS
ncbi:MAG: NADH-quinone oxidoreductase subunit NuoF [Deltaproteobacteria bacterium]|nr:NADH-quinone oxidoreductase subunit NuoF [Deltaproteobacteria bacterium]